MISSCFTYQYLIDQTPNGSTGCEGPRSTGTERLSEMADFDHFAPSIGWLRGKFEGQAQSHFRENWWEKPGELCEPDIKTMKHVGQHVEKPSSNP